MKLANLLTSVVSCRTGLSPPAERGRHLGSVPVPLPGCPTPAGKTRMCGSVTTWRPAAAAAAAHGPHRDNMRRSMKTMTVGADWPECLSSLLRHYCISGRGFLPDTHAHGFTCTRSYMLWRFTPGGRWQTHNMSETGGKQTHERTVFLSESFVELYTDNFHKEIKWISWNL